VKGGGPRHEKLKKGIKKGYETLTLNLLFCFIYFKSLKRFKMFSYENQNAGRVIGVDEVGYGAWAGPVFVCAAWINQEAAPTSFLQKIDDSKRLSPEKRRWVYQEFCSHPEYGQFCLADASAEEVDQKNVLQATLHIMNQACQALSFDHVLVDGNRPLPLPHTCLIKGDQKSLSIALASIIAKVTRDQLMDHLHTEFPEFKWNTNKGYGTAHHRRVLGERGYTPYHRKSYVLKGLEL